jgi:hypothetical protein
MSRAQQRMVRNYIQGAKPPSKRCCGYMAQGLPPHDDVPLERFARKRSNPDGLERTCKDCSKVGRKLRAEKREASAIDQLAAETHAGTAGDFSQRSVPVLATANGMTGREAYFSIAEEMSAADFTMDDMEPAVVELAKGYAKRAHKRFPPKPVEPTMTISSVSL